MTTSAGAPLNDEGGTGHGDARVGVALQLWRNRLLDLSKRNRALNYKPTRVSTVAVVDEQPAEVFRHLCLNAEPMRFRPTLPTAARGRTTADADRVVEDDSVLDVEDRLIGADDASETPSALEMDFAPYDRDTLDERHRDDVLQALATPEALDKSLRRLDEQARATLEEQGVNVLFLALGMLHYTESADSTDVLRAPLVMVPVTLNRRSARTGYAVQMSDEEPMVNPALAEQLSRMLGITLPELPAAEEFAAGPALQSFYKAVSELAAERVRAGWQGWAVKTDIFLGLFAFQKLVMFKDLDANAASFGAHPLVRRLVTRDAPPGTYLIGLPPDVRDMELDREFPPERTAQVVDADASQLRAIAAVSRGHDLVIEGPPGTGKSQTITNLIAQALADGKSVLFVAEKMAALQVVHNRLVKAGLGEFCLELHASKANKRQVMQDLKVALDASLQRPSADRRTHRLPSVRTELSDYARAVHEPYGALDLSPYAATGLLNAVLDAPRVPLRSSIEGITPEILADTEQRLDDLSAAAETVGLPARHPWRETGRTFYTPGALEDVGRALDDCLDQLEQVVSLAAEVERSFSLPPVRTAADVDIAMSVAAVFERSPGAPLAVLESDAWNVPPADAIALVDSVRTLQRWRVEIDKKFAAAVLDQPHADDIAYVQGKTSGVFGFLSILDGRFRAIKRRWLSLQAPEYAPSLAEQAQDLALVDRYAAARREMEGKAAQGRALFGPLWLGERSEAAVLDRYMEWVVEMRGVCVRHGLGHEALQVASSAAPDVHKVRELQDASAKRRIALERLQREVEWPVGYLLDAPFSDVLDRVQAMRDSLGAANSWATFEQARQRASLTPAGWIVAVAMQNSGGEGDLPFPVLRRTYRRALLERLLEAVVAERAPLRDFNTLTHEQRLREFRQLDEWVLRENQATVVSTLRSAAQERLREPAARAGLPFLQREMAKQRNIAPLRRTLQHAEPTIRAIKPCFLMSPLTVAQYLDGRTPSFDVVIFDEASQLPPEDAIGAIARGRQLVVVGDPKQLPPTNFFASAGPAANVPLDEEGLPLIEDSESILEEFMGAGVPVTRLRWHYRSAHESLITFSNVSFYDADLYTFPSVETGADDLGLSFEFIENGVYEGKGLNLVEARRVADAVVRHARERPDESLGVGTFNLRQQLAILDELELRRRQDPKLEPFFSRGADERFFVKNLENIQGDERDVIFLSVTYAKGPDGRLRYNFGPINGENGWRRLNVITTRARRRMRVFSSMRGDEINAATTSSRGAHLLREFLLYAEHGRLDSVIANVGADTESPFERELAAELVRRGITVVPQVGVAGYRVDLGILDPSAPGRFVCGIECDGVSYHSSETARDRDRLRQQVLEARGWTIHRVWSTDWFKDRRGQVDRLMGLIGTAREKARQNADEREAASAREPVPDSADTDIGVREADPSWDAESLAGHTSTSGGAARAYMRPHVEPYRMADILGWAGSSDLLSTPTSKIAEAVASFVEFESPMHEDDLATRVAWAWGNSRVGSRIAAKIQEALRSAVRSSRVVRRGAFLWSSSGAVASNDTVPVRSRAGMRIPGDRIAPEEIAGAVRLVLRAAGGLPRDELLSEVRQVLGVGRSTLAPVFDVVIDQGLANGELGEGSAGIALRA